MNNEPSNQLTIYCDGGARGNPGPAAAAFVIEDSTGKILHKQGFYLGIATNNQAEYHAVLESLKWITNNYYQLSNQLTINYYLDSLLVVNQLNNKFKTKNKILAEKFQEIRKYLDRLQKYKIKIIFNYISRSQNFLADKSVNQTLDSQNFPQ
ncbi:ribonuclease HI family protein [Candidatus Amesbacteria bacterium]|nr:ribonuclease HI family protein [Candidatus Amesbacteria bacterium]